MRRVVSLAFGLLLLIPPGVWGQGAPLGPEFRVNTFTTSSQYVPAIASDPAGNFVVVWQSNAQDGSLSAIFGQRYDALGAPQGPEFRVNTYTTAVQSEPDVASDSAGNFVVVWESDTQDGSGVGVFGQRYASSGAPLGPEFPVNTYTTDIQSSPDVTADSAGNFVVVWHSETQDGLTYGVFGQRYDSSGAPLGPEFPVNTYATSNQGLPSVARDSSGNFVVVWISYTQDGSSYGIFGQRYASSGAPLGSEFRVNTYTTNYQQNPSVAVDTAGNFVVVWRSYNQDGSAVGSFGQRYASSGTPLGPEFGINTYTTSGQGYPTVAADTDGNFVVVWRSNSQDGAVFGIFGQRYASSGTPLGPEFRVNTYTTDNQSFPAVAADSAGNFVVVWQSFAQDGSAFGVFGQRFGPILPVELMQFGIE